MKALIKSLAISSALVVMSSGAYAADVSGDVETNADLGNVTQSATKSKLFKRSENELNIGNVKDKSKVSGSVKTTVTTENLTQTAEDGSKNTINIGNVEGGSEKEHHHRK